MTTVGEALVQGLMARDVDVVFGIPGVHTIELYRGIAAAGLRHVTPRHEQGAGFMADGYGRVSGKPGVAFVITGPGLTNAITPMAQARADSVPMLVVSGVNARETLGKGLGCLHELPDQEALMRQIALVSETVSQPEGLAAALERCFAPFGKRPGPAHLSVPLDVMGLAAQPPLEIAEPAKPPHPDLSAVIARLEAAERPVILAGGGVKSQELALRRLSEALDAPVVQTVNARGLMHGHPLTVSASPSLAAVHGLISDADALLALGTELGPTDYDMYGNGQRLPLENLIRIDVSAEQLARHPCALTVEGDLTEILPALARRVPAAPRGGEARAEAARTAAWAELEQACPGYPALVEQVAALRDAFPKAIFAGDSTQAVYAANLYYDHDRPGGWFNGATGFGALGYALPAAIGASIAAPDAQVIALMGDGGAQFTLPELGVAQDEKLPILFVVWNNAAYLEIANSMQAAGITPTGCHPIPPDFASIADAYGIIFARTKPENLTETLAHIRPLSAPMLLEIDITDL
ncbi:MAG: 5-guanidino-2-oxopentanoate decarboxylase [Pseudomonadota bacterium]